MDSFIIIPIIMFIIFFAFLIIMIVIGMWYRKRLVEKYGIDVLYFPHGRTIVINNTGMQQSAGSCTAPYAKRLQGSSMTTSGETVVPVLQTFKCLNCGYTQDNYQTTSVHQAPSDPNT